jgi:hypothetical protein
MEIPAALDLERFSLDNLDGASGRSLVERCRAELAKDGLFNLDGLVRPAAVAQAITEVAPAFAADAFHHARDHNIYFDDRTDVAPAEHGALRRPESSNLTICADQITDGLICHLYEWPPLARFLSLTMGMKELHTMDDPLARVNVMSYGDGQQLNWHFDRSEFTTTLLLQEADDGGVFEYRSDLRKDDDANLDGVADLLHGGDPAVETLPLMAGTLTVFRGRNTAHRAAPVTGRRPRLVSVFSYYERPGVMFSDDERIGFYGRAA